MTEYVYSQERHPLCKGRTFRNPHHFVGVEADATKVFIVGDWPNVRTAYRNAGVVVEGANDAPVAGPTQPEPAAPPEQPVEPADDDSTIPDDWSALSWPDLRRLANKFSSVPVINKPQAFEAIEAEIARRVVDDEPSRDD